MSLLSAIRHTSAGAAILTDWLGEGGVPVSQGQSNARADVCAICPENRAPGWWNYHADAIASWIRRCLAIKNDLGYRVDKEDLLAMCRKCGCSNPLKVHVPISHIRRHITDKQLLDYPPYCWQRKELAI